MTGGHPLDDVAWSALTGPQAGLARAAAGGRALGYRDGIAPFCGVGVLDREGWDALAELVGPGGTAVLLRGEVPPTPAGWTELVREPATQLVAERPVGRSGEDGVVELGDADSPEMVRLAAETARPLRADEPPRRSLVRGAPRGTPRRDGRRAHRPPGWGEVSGVCVAAEARGAGLGALVTRAAAGAIEERGDRAMLHTRLGNDGADGSTSASASPSGGRSPSSCSGATGEPDGPSRGHIARHPVTPVACSTCAFLAPPPSRCRGGA